MQDHRNAESGAGTERTVARASETLAELLDRPLAAGLYLVATPIGNLSDISLRALSVLARAPLIAAEDTRHSKKLLSHFGIDTPLTPYHEHNAERERPKLLARIRSGYSVALISDAGTPLVSDPGYKLVREALDEGLTVTSIPGPSATLAALTSVGLPTDTFLFAGFLPPKSGARQTRLAALKDVPATLILFETAPRLAKALADMAEVLGPREAAIARELTKLHETVLRGTLDALAGDLAEQTLKGEVVVVIAPPRADETEIDHARILADLKAALETQSFRDAVRGVTEAHGVKRARVYELGLSLTREPE
ncbi:MAG: 16S rRNA (cytidine(1402)-2'-O)-methyltransferase [Methyloceanibacter sp.]|uniref:16S rRNA (cytidine(1402)-2'-O)-methyltransferase n=1 Tax=Methyloceanibacter sp. TaxID=1965321 RepID=UPI003EE23D97